MLLSNKFVLFSVIGLGLLSGCSSSSGGGGGTTALTPTQAQNVAGAVDAELQVDLYFGLQEAIGIAEDSARASSKGSVKPAATTPPPFTAECNLLPDGITTSCTYSGTLACQSAGSILITNGTAVGIVDQTFTGTMQAQTTFTPMGCTSNNVIVLNGAPNLLLTGTVIFTDGAVQFPLNLTENGNLSFGPGVDSNSSTIPPGSCPFDITSSFNTGTNLYMLSGTACGQNIAGTYPIPVLPTP
jgi:hypothetical protein